MGIADTEDEQKPRGILFPIYLTCAFCLSFALAPIFMFWERGRRRIWERFGSWSPPHVTKRQKVIWFHGASVGEINGLLPIMKEFRRRYPDLPILLSAASVTGLDRAGDIPTYTHLVPFDHPIWIRRALQGYDVVVFLFGENELWPGLLAELADRQVPIVLVNGRMSTRSYQRFRWVRGAIQRVFEDVDRILVGDRESQKRYCGLGVQPEQVLLTGNSKYDVPLTVKNETQRSQLKQRVFGNGDPVIVLGSLWPKEEELWFPIIAQRLQGGATLNVLIAPRHKERFEYFASKLKEYGIEFARWQDRKGEVPIADGKALLLDTYGELAHLYSIANLAFIGGTLVPVGGHNPLEAAAYQVCPVVGQYTETIQGIVEDLEAVNGVHLVSDRRGATELLNAVIDCEESLAVSGIAAHEVWQAHSGATKRIMEEVENFLSESSVGLWDCSLRTEDAAIGE